MISQLVLHLVTLAEDGDALPEIPAHVSATTLYTTIALFVGGLVLREVIGGIIKKRLGAADKLEEQEHKKLDETEKDVSLLKHNDLKQDTKLERLDEKYGALAAALGKLEADLNGVAQKTERQIRELKEDMKEALAAHRSAFDEELKIQRKSQHDFRNEVLAALAKLTLAIEERA